MFSLPSLSRYGKCQKIRLQSRNSQNITYEQIKTVKTILPNKIKDKLLFLSKIKEQLKASKGDKGTLSHEV